MQSTTIPALVIRRTLNASPQRVYEAWTQPELAKQFMCPEDVTIADCSFDVRVGGAYRIVMRKPDGEELVVRGVYRDVQPNRRLEMNWTWEEDRPEDEQDTQLVLEFAPHGTGTELTLTQTQFSKAESRTNHEGGWNSILDKMETLPA